MVTTSLNNLTHTQPLNSMRIITTPLQRLSQTARHLHQAMSTQPTRAPWRADLLSHINQMDSPTFVLSTLHKDSYPRSRTVVFRGLWAELPVNPKNDAPLNPAVYESDLLTITSDARMDKMVELNPDGSPFESGGGQSVEACFWIVPTKTQWRLRGKAYLVGPDIESSGSSTKQTLERYMRPKNTTTNKDSFDWPKELTAHFGNLSPGMRGTFRNPPPGTPRSDKPADGLGPGQKVDDLNDEIARTNFRVVVIVPDEVDRVDLTDPADGKRWNYKLMGDEWKETELWP